MLRQLDKYELLEEIGHGGMATVYKARDVRLDRFVAVKVLHPHLQKTEEARSRFTREAQSVAKLAHSNILEIYDYSGDASEESYIAAELLTGPTLKRFIETHGALPAEVAAAFTIQIAQALQAAHAAHIVHRDVKPENVLLHEDRCLKLTDFGIAQMVDAQSMTATGQILGSPGHMAPEQVSTGDVDERSDIFSLGTVLYFVATGRLPFVGRNPHQILKRIVDGEYPDPLRVQPSVGGELAAIIRRTMAVDPDERPTNADALEGELQRFLAGLDIEDAGELVEEFLKDPESTTARLRENALAVLMRRAHRAVDNGVRAEAIECLNRILAIDDGNEEAIALTTKLTSERGFRPFYAAIAAAVLMLGAMGVYALVDTGDTAGASDAGVVDAGSPDASADALAMVANPQDGDVEAGPPMDAGDAGSDVDTGINAGERDAGRNTMRPRGPRTVVFRPTPQRVSISVDGAPLRPYGPSFSRVELTPGRHRFRIVGAENCCQELAFELSIPAGSGDFILARRLTYRPARLVVRSNVLPASVTVEASGTAAAASGNAGGIFSVPVDALSQLRVVTVSAPGHQPTTERVQLRAGRLAAINVQLAPSP